MPHPSPPVHMRADNAGFTYVGLLVGVALLGLVLSMVGEVWRTTAQREREKQLLFVGRQFEAAIAGYYQAGRQFPQSLDDLVEDKRWPEPRHFLRRLYADPLTGRTDWILIGADGLGITGVASSSSAIPIKKSGFAPQEEDFADAQTYQDWKFVFTPHFGRRKLASPPVNGN